VAISIEAEQALALHQILDGQGVRVDHVDVDAVVAAHTLDEVVGLRVQSTRVEAEHGELEAGAGRHVDQHHVLGAAEGDGATLGVARERELDPARRILVSG
jgi:hypothetical protein